ncbi:hypothetical protein CYMTET_36512 [Cymbomonas tetramitiformis]|uniref:Reverse transcriptase domain-containing protein n=1 Tax=Cymbomonas tetramitiformis TaxID=36881 RepID=A0AAE0CHJ4_9CHLO|nr:hypothetical protein CYMTET_36512 [Cymbomonas tetramitiformis]
MTCHGACGRVDVIGGGELNVIATGTSVGGEVRPSLCVIGNGPSAVLSAEAKMMVGGEERAAGQDDDKIDGSRSEGDGKMGVPECGVGARGGGRVGAIGDGSWRNPQCGRWRPKWQPASRAAASGRAARQVSREKRAAGQSGSEVGGSRPEDDDEVDEQGSEWVNGGGPDQRLARAIESAVLAGDVLGGAGEAGGQVVGRREQDAEGPGAQRHACSEGSPFQEGGVGEAADSPVGAGISSPRVASWPGQAGGAALLGRRVEWLDHEREQQTQAGVPPASPPRVEGLVGVAEDADAEGGGGAVGELPPVVAAVVAAVGTPQPSSRPDPTDGLESPPVPEGLVGLLGTPDGPSEGRGDPLGVAGVASPESADRDAPQLGAPRPSPGMERQRCFGTMREVILSPIPPTLAGEFPSSPPAPAWLALLPNRSPSVGLMRGRVAQALAPSPPHPGVRPPPTGSSGDRQVAAVACHGPSFPWWLRRVTARWSKTRPPRGGGEHALLDACALEALLRGEAGGADTFTHHQSILSRNFTADELDGISRFLDPPESVVFLDERGELPFIGTDGWAGAGSGLFRGAVISLSLRAVWRRMREADARRYGPLPEQDSSVVDFTVGAHGLSAVEAATTLQSFRVQELGGAGVPGWSANGMNLGDACSICTLEWESGQGASRRAKRTGWGPEVGGREGAGEDAVVRRPLLPVIPAPGSAAPRCERRRRAVDFDGDPPPGDWEELYRVSVPSAPAWPARASEERTFADVVSLVKEGQLSKAIRRLDPGALAPLVQETLEALKDLHPAGDGLPGRVQAAPLELEDAAVEAECRRLPVASGPGCSQLRFEHIGVIFGGGDGLPAIKHACQQLVEDRVPAGAGGQSGMQADADAVGDVFQPAASERWVSSAEGAQQGDPLCPFFMAVALQPALQTTLDEHPDVFIMAYLDDIHILGPPDKVCAAYDTIVRLLRAAGLELNVPKSTVFCPDGACLEFADVVDEAGTPMPGAVVPLPGIKVLGIPVGSDRWVTDKCVEMALAAGAILPKLARLDDPQEVAGNPYALGEEAVALSQLPTRLDRGNGGRAGSTGPSGGGPGCGAPGAGEFACARGGAGLGRVRL